MLKEAQVCERNLGGDQRLMEIREMSNGSKAWQEAHLVERACEVGWISYGRNLRLKCCRVWRSDQRVCAASGGQAAIPPEPPSFQWYVQRLIAQHISSSSRLQARSSMKSISVCGPSTTRMKGQSDLKSICPNEDANNKQIRDYHRSDASARSDRVLPEAHLLTVSRLKQQ